MGLQTERFTTSAGIALAVLFGIAAYGAVLGVIFWAVAR